MRIVLCAILAVPVMPAANWPQWRGPNGTGVTNETGLPVEWGRGQNVAWSSPLPGLGVSGPVVWGNRVFLTYQTGAGALRGGNHPSFIQGGSPAAAGELPLGGARPSGVDDRIEFAVAAFQASDGKRLWEHRVAAEGGLPEVHEKRNLATPSPVTDGERVYAWFSNGQLLVLDIAGKPVWSRHLGKEYKTFDLEWGHASSPVLHHDKLLLLSYQASSASLLALDKRTGKEIWKTEPDRAGKSYSTPLVIETPGGPEIIVNSSERIEGFDPQSGKPLWQYNLPHRFAVPMPVFHDGMIYLNRGYRSSRFWRYGRAGAATSRTHTWRGMSARSRRMSHPWFTPAVFSSTPPSKASPPALTPRTASASGRSGSAGSTAPRRLPPTGRSTCSAKRAKLSCSSRAARRRCWRATSSTAASSHRRRSPEGASSFARTVI